MTRLSAFIEGVGLLGPGLNQWPHAAALLTGQAPYAPERTALPRHRRQVFTQAPGACRAAWLRDPAG
ncbi:hypothetical protein ACQCRI_25420, partial [Ralstonia pseudosolanacearum]